MLSDLNWGPDVVPSAPHSIYKLACLLQRIEKQRPENQKVELRQYFFFKLLMYPKLGRKKKNNSKDKRKKLEFLKNPSVHKKSRSFKEIGTLPSILKAGKYF